MVRYIEIALGSPSQRGRAVPVSEIPALQKHAQQQQLELYRSYYFFDHTLVDHLNAYKTIRGYQGSPVIDLITLDVDKNGDTDEYTHQRAIGLFHRIQDLNVSDLNVRPYYSGSGYHFVMPNLWNFRTVDEIKETLQSLFPECDSIYDKSRIIRVSNTINFKTQRYKVPLTSHELLHNPTESILSMAKEPRGDFLFGEFELSNHLEYLKKKPKVVLTEQPKVVLDEGMSRIVTCMQKLYNQGPIKGSRHQSMLRMVSAFKRSGIPRSGIEAMMLTWTKGEMEIGEIRKVVTDIFNKNYQFGCHDEIMEKHCDERCMFFKSKSYNATVPKDVAMMEEGLRKQATTEAEEYLELATFLELKESFGIYPEEFVVAEGDTGLGKSAFWQNVLVVNPHMKALYLNFEVGERLMYRRFLQIAHAKTKFDIIQHYSNPKAETLSGKINHIFMVSNRITLHAFEQLVMGGTYPVVIADTLECFVTPGITDITPKTEHIAHELKRIAKKYRIIIIAVHHISKSSIQDPQGNRRSLTVHAGKGSSAVEQEADKVLLFEGNINEPVRRIRSAKARDESPFDTYMMFDAERTFKFYKEKLWTSEPYSETSTSNSVGLVKASHSAPSVVVQFSP